MNDSDAQDLTQMEDFSRTVSIGSETALVRAIQASSGEEPCFRTDRRLLCRDVECLWRRECRRLVAAWKR